MINLYDEVCNECSKITAEHYSTSFSRAIKLLHKDLRIPVYSIYGFVRFADEIVDTFHHFNKQELLQEFNQQLIKPKLPLIKKQICRHHTPVRLLYGKHDRIIVTSVGNKFMKGIESCCTLREINCGHQVLHEKHSKEILNAILQ